ncbi:hypothetical protein N9195_02590 [bacterium]|nr:hypothetical protein [bacterium]
MMLFYIGLTVLAGCAFYSAATTDSKRHPQPPVNIGYLLVASSCFLGAALYRESQSTDTHVRYGIYLSLAERPLPFDNLISSVRNGLGSEYTNIRIKKIVGEMLENNRILVSEGKLHLPEA